MANNIRRDLIVLLLGRVIQAIIVLVSLRLSTTIIPKNEFGLVYYITALQVLFSLFLINPVSQYFNRNINRWRVSDSLLSSLLYQMLYILFVSAICIFSLLTLAHFHIIELKDGFVFIAASMVLSIGLNQTVVPLLNMLDHRVEFVALSLLTAFLTLILGGGGVLFFDATANVWLLGMVISNVIVAFLAIYKLNKILPSFSSLKLPAKSAISSLRKVFEFSSPISVATIFMWYFTVGYRIELESKFGLSFLAELGVGFAIAGQVFYILESLITQYFVPILYRSIEGVGKESRSREFSSYINICIPLYLSAAIFMSFAVKNLIPFVVGEEYYSAYLFSVFGVWVEFFRVVTNSLGLATQIEMKTNLFVPSYIISAAMVFCGIYFFDLTVLGVCYLLLAANIACMIVMLFFTSRMLMVEFFYYRFILVAISLIPVGVYFIYFPHTPSFSLNNFIYASIGSFYYLMVVYVFWKKCSN